VEGDRVKDIRFNGSGCAISKASSSIMTTIVKGKSTAEVESLFDSFHQLVTTGETGSEDLGKLAVMAGVHKYPARVKCATLAWHTLNNCLTGADKVAKTE
jgi:nitrogen fixation NifU-like protein